MAYRQLAQAQRYQIHAFRSIYMSQRQIALPLGVHSSTISREQRRNTTATGYEPDTVHRLMTVGVGPLGNEQSGFQA